MRTEDLFKKGVTPKEGPNAGKRFVVENIDKDGNVLVWKGEALEELPSGSYVLWEPPKSLFDDPTLPSTWGNLKKAVEQEGLSDDTRLVVSDTDLFVSISWAACRKALFRLSEDSKGKYIHII